MVRPETDIEKTSAKSRKCIPLPEGLERRILAYALSAGAAGIGLLAGATPAKANIVYTPANIPFSPTATNYINISLDGSNVDIAIFARATLTYCSWCKNQDEIVGNLFAYPQSAGLGILRGPLPSGFQIGPTNAWEGNAWLKGWTYRSSFVAGSFGPWAQKQGYLAVKFDIGGETHYGWIAGDGSTQDPIFEISGWAYETIPNRGLLAGQTQGTPEPCTLGLLALGSAGLAFWRKKREQAVRQ
jgi:hypothetical protein